MRAMAHDGSVGGWQVIQAMEFIRALRVQLGEMTGQLARIERQNDVTVRNGRARALRIEAAALRRDIREAQIYCQGARYAGFLVRRLQL